MAAKSFDYTSMGFITFDCLGWPFTAIPEGGVVFEGLELLEVRTGFRDDRARLVAEAADDVVDAADGDHGGGRHAALAGAAGAIECSLDRPAHDAAHAN